MRKTVSVIAMVWALSACSDVKDTVIPMDTSKWDTELAPKVAELEQSEKELLAAYLLRTRVAAALKGDGQATIAIGTTVGDALEAQRQFVKEREEREAKEAAEAQALKDKLEAQSKAVREQIMASVTVTLLSKKNLYSDYRAGRYSEQQQFIIGVENKSDKQVIGVSGELDFFDVFEKEAGSVNFDISEKIAPGATYKWNGTRDYNQYIDSHKALWNLEEGKYTTKFTPEAVLFADGTKLLMPQN